MYSVHSKRVPAFVLPDDFVDTSTYEQQEDGAPDAQSRRDKMRPDIMTVEITPNDYQQYKLQPNMHQLSPNMPNGAARKVLIVEGRYSSDTRYIDKLHEKQQQHQRLQASLTAYGYNLTVLPITLGFYGTVSNSTVEAVRTLGIERGRVNKLLLAPHTHAITTLQATGTLRRKLEDCFKNRTSHSNRPT